MGKRQIISRVVKDPREAQRGKRNVCKVTQQEMGSTQKKGEVSGLPLAWGGEEEALWPRAAKAALPEREAGTRRPDSGVPPSHPPCCPAPDDTPVAAAKNMPGDSADLFGDGSAEDGGAANGRLWRTVIIGEQEHRIDLHMIRPYMRVVTHGGETMPRGPLLAPTTRGPRSGPL